VKSFGLSTAVGFLLAVALTWWVRPDTSSGTIFLVVTVTLFCTVMGTIFSFLLGALRKEK
jgi:hypothetical protein